MSESACMNSMTRYCQTDSSDLFFVLLRYLKNWIFVPRCKVNLTVDGHSCEIGYKNIDDAMMSCLAKLGIKVDEDSFNIAKYDKDGMSLRILMKKNLYMGNCSFYNNGNLLGEEYAPIGCCVEFIYW